MASHYVFVLCFFLLLSYGRPMKQSRPLYFALWFLSFFFFFSSHNLSGRRLDVYHTSTHGVALMRIYNAGLKYAARGSPEMQDIKNRQKLAVWASPHNFVGLYLCN